MELQSGSTYKSPYHGRYIKVMSILDRGDELTLAVYLIDPDDHLMEMTEMTVSKRDVRDWKLVTNV